LPVNIPTFPTRRSSDLKDTVPTQRKYTFFAVLTISVCILAIYLYRHRQGHTGKIDNFIISMTGALQENFFYLGHGTRTIAEHYRSEEHTSELQSRFDLV